MGWFGDTVLGLQNGGLLGGFDAAFNRGQSPFVQPTQQAIQAGNLELQSKIVNIGARIKALQEEGLMPPGLLGQVSGAPSASPAPTPSALPPLMPGMTNPGDYGRSIGLPPQEAGAGDGDSALPTLPMATPVRPQISGGASMRDALKGDVLFPGAGKGIYEKQFPGPTDLQRALQAANIDPNSPAGQTILQLGAQNSSGVKPYIGGERPGVPLQRYDPAQARYNVESYVPLPIAGTTLAPGANGQMTFQRVPGASSNMAENDQIAAQAKAQYEPMQVTDAEGNQYTVPRSRLGGATPRSGAPGGASAPRPAPPGVSLPLPAPGAAAGAPGALPPTGGPGGLPSGLGPRQQANLQGQGKGAGEDFNQVRADAAEAARTIDDIRTVRQIPAETGRLAPSQEIIGGYLDALGVNSSYVRKATNLQEFNSIAANYVLGKQLEQKGVQTEGDARRMRETFASMTNIGEANDFILRVVEAQKTRMLDKQAFYEANASDPKVAAKWSQTVRQTPLVAKGPSGPVFLNEYLETAKAQGVPMDQALAAWRKRAK